MLVSARTERGLPAHAITRSRISADNARAWVSRHGVALSRAAAYLSSFLVAVPMLYHAAHGTKAYLGLLEDDHFYYAIVADNLVTLGRTTYDGTTLTNGFHPLWFMVVTAIRTVTGGIDTPFHVVLTIVSLMSMIATYELGRRFARELGAPAALSAAIPAVYAVGTARLFTSGMECVLAVPVFLALLVALSRPMPMTTARAARLGLLASLAVLARLDLALAVALLIIGYALVVRPPLSTAMREMAGFCLGGLLVPAYVAVNLSVFGSPFPVSMLAKGLSDGVDFNLTYARIAALGTVYGPTVSVLLPAGVLSWFMLVWRDAGPQTLNRVVGGVTLLFTLAFLGINAVTGWTFFGWYAYPFATATTVALVFVSRLAGSWMPARALAPAVIATLVALAPVSALRYAVDHGPRWSVSDNTLLAMSHELAERMDGREGLVAMGAIAGFATYVLERPVLQLEGIIGDRRLVEHLERRSPLEGVLREYGARYLVVSLAHVRAERNDGCYLVTQPHAEWAGERSAKMRGEICAEPIERFITPRGENSWSRFPSLETLVWDLRDARWRQPHTP